VVTGQLDLQLARDDPSQRPAVPLRRGPRPEGVEWFVAFTTNRQLDDSLILEYRREAPRTESAVGASPRVGLYQAAPVQGTPSAAQTRQLTRPRRSTTVSRLRPVDAVTQRDVAHPIAFIATAPGARRPRMTTTERDSDGA